MIPPIRFGSSLRDAGVTTAQLPVLSGWGVDHLGRPIPPPEVGDTVLAYVHEGAPFTAPPGWSRHERFAWHRITGGEAPTATMTFHSPDPHIVQMMILTPDRSDT